MTILLPYNIMFHNTFSSDLMRRNTMKVKLGLNNIHKKNYLLKLESKNTVPGHQHS